MIYLPVSGVLHHVDHLLLRIIKSVSETLEQQALVRVFFGEIVVWQVLLHLGLHMEWKSVLQEPTHFSAVLAVAIADGEEVTMLEPKNVGRRDVGILVCLVGVVWSDTSLGCERELGDNIANLVGLGHCDCLLDSWHISDLWLVWLGFDVGL